MIELIPDASPTCNSGLDPKAGTREENDTLTRGTSPLFAMQIPSAVAAIVLWLVLAAALLAAPLLLTRNERRAGVVRPLSTESIRVIALQACRHRALQRLDRAGEYADARGSGRVVDLGNGRMRVETQLPAAGERSAYAVTCVVTGTAAHYMPEDPSRGWIFERLSGIP